MPSRFAIAPGVIVPAGGYSYSTGRVSYSLGQQRRVSGRLSASTGSLYGGTKSDVSYSGRWGVMPQFSLEPSVTLAWGSLPYGDFTARLIGSRFTVTPSARMQISSLVQFNVDGKTLTSSARLRWEYTGGSDLFVVYSDGRETRDAGLPRAAQPHLCDQGHAALQVLDVASDPRVVVLGGGPAGAAASLLLAKWGHAVRLITRPPVSRGLAVSLAAQLRQAVRCDRRQRRDRARRIPAIDRQHGVVGRRRSPASSRSPTARAAGRSTSMRFGNVILIEAIAAGVVVERRSTGP